MDTIETIQFTQGELRLIQISLAQLVKVGQLGLGDIMNIYPMLVKLNEKIKPLPQDKPEEAKQ